MKFMEDSLDLPLRQVLPIIQQRILQKTTYFGIAALKNPLDFWVYQELIFELKPDVILEIGNLCGGGTLALANLCDALGRGKVIGLDITHASVSHLARRHPRISWVEGDACASFEQVGKLLNKDDQVLIIEDSAHTYEHTLKVLRTYSPLIKPGGYFIVEDGIAITGWTLVHSLVRTKQLRPSCPRTPISSWTEARRIFSSPGIPRAFCSA